VKTFVFFVAVLPVFLISCAHKQAAPTSSVDQDTAVTASLEEEDKATNNTQSKSDQSELASVDQQEEVAPDKADAIDDQTDSSDDDFDDEWEDDLDDEDEVVEVSDPIIYFNKAMFHFNDKLYFWVLKPVGTVYKTILPEFVRISIKNFFHNITFPVRFVSSALQGKGERAQAELGRFMLNSTFGVLGFGNPAKQFDHLNPPEEDLGQTFAHWGVGEGFYLVLPLFGPSTARDGVGLIGDYFLYPVTYLECWETRLVINSTRVVNETSLRIGDYEAFKKAAIDPYASMRDGYIQDRRIDVVE
jgi:phospholipid-binding lipoprotein MlaA